MKNILAIIVAFMLSISAAFAEEKKELTPQQKWTIASGLTAVIVGPIVLPAAILSGKREGLCKVMGSTYDPKGADQCPNGQWLFVIPFLSDKPDYNG